MHASLAAIDVDAATLKEQARTNKVHGVIFMYIIVKKSGAASERDPERHNSPTKET